MSRSPRLRELFVYIANRTLSNRLDDLTEVRIAESVFGRRDYNPSEDNIVRVSVRQLRTKNAEYYRSERRPDDLELNIPKGGYHAVFRSVANNDVTDAAPPAAPQADTPARLRIPRLTPVRLSIGIAGVALVLLLAVLLAENRQLSKQNQQLRSSLAPQAPPLFHPFVAVPDRRTEVVVSDSALVLYEKLLGRYLTLEEYSSGRYPPLSVDTKLPPGTSMESVSSLLRAAQICSFGAIRVVMELFRAYPASGHNLTVHYARNIPARNFGNNDNFVLIGTFRANPWTSLFETGSTFRCRRSLEKLASRMQALLPAAHVYFARSIRYGSLALIMPISSFDTTRRGLAAFW